MRAGSLRITITQKDIELGHPQQGSSCPLARALRRRFPDSYINVGLWYAHIGGRNFGLSPKAATFVKRLDTSGRAAVAPTTVVLRATDF